MEPQKQVFMLQCTRCKISIESHTTPAPRMTAFLCNPCHLKWKEIESKMIGHAYEDEMRKAFVNFMNDLTNLRNIHLR